MLTEKKGLYKEGQSCSGAGAGAGVEPMLLFILVMTLSHALRGPAHSAEKPVKGPCCDH